LDLTGAVRIIDKTAKGSTTITGHDGHATLDPNAKGSGSGLRTASLNGPVRIQAVQSKTSGGTITATGSRLELDSASHTVTLSGNVNVTGNQQSTLGELRGADRAVLVLNDQGQVASVRVSQGAAK
jgi:lipopolysaccharide export system protein LptA